MTEEPPVGWQSTSVGAVTKYVRGVTYQKEHARNQPAEGLLPVLRANNIGAGLNFEDLVYVPSRFVSSEQLLCDGDIVFAMSSGSKSVVGKAAKATRPPAAGFGAFCGVLRPLPEVQASFLGYYFQTKTYRNRVSELSKGVNINNLKAEHLLDLPLPLPPAAEQQRIVSRIEELFSEIDEGERALERVGQLVERYRQSVLKAAVTGELTREWRESTAAADWSRAEISAIGAVTTGNTPPTADACNYGPGLPFLKPTDLDQGYTVTEYRQTLTDQGVQYCRPLKAQAVLVTCIGATIGKLGLARMACATNQQINAVEVDNSRMRAKFLYWCLASPEGQRAIIGGASATTLPILNKSRFQAITVPVPGLVEQDLIVDLIEQHIGQAERSAAAAAVERRRLQALRQSILKAAFSGQLVPQDPRDEPASALLARLAAQSAAAPPAPKRRGRKVPA